MTTKDGGQIFGFDISQGGNDGVLASSGTTQPGIYRVSVETFDQDTGTITKSFAQETGCTNSYAVDGIFAGDLALVTHFVNANCSLFAKRRFAVMNPVTAQKFTGTWTSPRSLGNIDVLQNGVNQTSRASVLFVNELDSHDNPDVIVTDLAANAIDNVIRLDPNLFSGADGPQMAQYTSAGKAVIALSPDAGAVGAPGAAPINVLIDLNTGALTRFTGFNRGPYGSGFVNGLAVDPNTGIAATTTELNAQVEFYDLNKRAGIVAEQLPCASDVAQFFSGAGIAVDPMNKLFLVTDPNYACGGGSALLIYDESARLIETITGFKFAIAEPPPALNPSKRMGWAFGPQFSQLQQFFY